MGRIEKKVSDSIRRTKVNSAVMTVLAAAGTLAIAAVAPNALQLLPIGKNRNRRMSEVRGVLGRLIRKGYVRIDTKNGTRQAVLTDKGSRFALLLEDNTITKEKIRRWDGKWRVLIFDIPEKRKSVRHQFRKHISSFGFFRFQDSVFVYPFPCEETITALKIELRLGNAVRYLVADHIENDSALRAHFSLPKQSKNN